MQCLPKNQSYLTFLQTSLYLYLGPELLVNIQTNLYWDIVVMQYYCISVVFG